jgi:hypothetical protein
LLLSHPVSELNRAAGQPDHIPIREAVPSAQAMNQVDHALERLLTTPAVDKVHSAI